MNEAQVCLIKSGCYVAKIHSHTWHVEEECEVRAVHVWPAGMGMAAHLKGNNLKDNLWAF